MGRVAKKWWWVAVAAAVVVAGGLVWFQPWALFVDETVDEALPTASAPAARPAPKAPNAPNAPSAPAMGPVTVAQGAFVSHEHRTEGTAKVVRLADGSHTLRIEGLDTSNGPDLHVFLSDAPVKKGVAGWRVFDDGRHTDLAELKGNKGDQNYPLPAGVDWSDYRSVSIWCDRFDVSFGAATLTRV
ncbi:DM13 domain-containing protein [Streptomyces sp. NPDC048604]|uniref:DM13 domain-containing protein n=1 Tax=Streptomyces sp. NPDC048604 TaxID=3365578 RepID=UPI00371E212C